MFVVNAPVNCMLLQWILKVKTITEELIQPKPKLSYSRDTGRF